MASPKTLYKTKAMTKAQRDKFLKSNRHGILAMAGREPYALPMGYFYHKGTVLLGLVDSGRKMKYLKRNKKVCFTICKPRWETPKMKEPCTTVVFEGSLEEVKNRARYGLKREIPASVKTYRIKVSKRGARKCNRKPCELAAELMRSEKPKRAKK
jgi:nitroimidazol reductase NimA-like FMN-containing flavoprotein (pyridoxamine 5'-phosphate oxidase superfamily)